MSFGTVQANAIQGSINTFSPNSAVFRNRIINGAMVIDQRNAGASVTPTNGQYLVDRWLAALTQASKFTVQQNAGSVTPPVGFSNYLGCTSSSAYSVGAGDVFYIAQRIEGFNTADLDWGTANAKTITISFWVRSSLTGTFGGSIVNSAGTRSYPFTYTISSTNTWEQKSITVAGDTTGTWVGATNGTGIQLYFSLGSGATFSGTANTWAGANYVSATGATSVVGTNGATFYITGVQLEAGSTATSFDYRPYGTELALCQRYFWKMAGNDGGGSFASIGSGTATDSTTTRIYVKHPVYMRNAPTFSYNGTITLQSGNSMPSASAINGTFSGFNSTLLQLTVASATYTTGYAVAGYLGNDAASWLAASAEL